MRAILRIKLMTHHVHLEKSNCRPRLFHFVLKFGFFFLKKIVLVRFKNAPARRCSLHDEVKKRLCQVLFEKRHLVVIFAFDSQRHHGNLEEAILEVLINGQSFIHGLF